MRVRKRVAALSLVAVMAVGGVAASGCTPAHPPAATWSSSETDSFAEYYFLTRIHANRAFWGRHGLWLHGTLTDKARAWSNWMSVGGCGGGRKICHSVLSHGINGVVHTWTLLGENVGVGGNIEALQKAFMESPGHAANILDPRWTHMGVGVIKRGGTYWVTMEFMRA